MLPQTFALAKHMGFCLFCNALQLYQMARRRLPILSGSVEAGKEHKMLKRALKFAIGPGIGIAVGGTLFRITNQHLYNETWPPILIQAILYLLVGYVECFVVIMLIEWIKSKLVNMH